jgi:hypothetical protein
VPDQSPLLSEALFAVDHVRRLKRLTRYRPVGRSLQRRVRALEDAALRMELEARARSICRWRAQGQAITSPLSTVEFFEEEYVDLQR